MSSMTLLFYFLAPLQNYTDVTSWCMQFIFGDKGAATCLIRKCPTCDWKRKEGKGEMEFLDEIWTRKPYSFCSYTNGGCSLFNLPLLFLCVRHTDLFLCLFYNCTIGLKLNLNGNIHSIKFDFHVGWQTAQFSSFNSLPKQCR